MIAIWEILKNGEKYTELEPVLKNNLDELLYKLCVLRFHYANPMYINSGYRSVEYNESIGGSKNSWHTKCLAVDFKDPTHEIYDFLTKTTTGIDLMRILDLYLENKNATPTWCHVQLRPPKSGSRVFNP